MKLAFGACLLLITLTARPISGSKLCLKDNSWYDVYTGKCQACEICDKKWLELEPCTEFRNTICVDLSLFKPNFKWMRHPSHEMETMDVEQSPAEEKVPIQERKLESTPSKVGWYNMWDIGVFVVLCLALACVLAATVILLMRHSGRLLNGNCNSKRASRFRLFSRDRLSTTEYMNSLATLDRRLAMDEILEKRKKAIFEPQLLPENIYTDEVFIDISGLPHHYYEDLRINDNDQEPTQSLLKTEQPAPHT